MSTLPEPTAGEHHARMTFPDVVFDIDTGADWDTMLSLLNGWCVRVHLFDGRSFDGTVRNEIHDDHIWLDDSEDVDGPTEVIHLDHVERIQVL
jgi:hypothetical protein